MGIWGFNNQVYIYIYMYAYIYICVYVILSVYLYIHTCLCVFIICRSYGYIRANRWDKTRKNIRFLCVIQMSSFEGLSHVRSLGCSQARL